jgi:hypothetical protein
MANIFTVKTLKTLDLSKGSLKNLFTVSNEFLSMFPKPHIHNYEPMGAPPKVGAAQPRVLR